VAAVIAVLVAVVLGGGSPRRDLAAVGVTSKAGAKRVQGRAVALVSTALLANHLPSPVSREVVVATASGALWVLGGLDAAGSTVATTYLLNPGDGAVEATAPLAEPTHDAAGALVGADALIVGGGAAAPAGAVQFVAPERSVQVVAQLGSARADARAVTIGRVTYVLGGYSGQSMDSEVLETTDGRSWRVVTKLPVPVRYPTLAVVGRAIDVLGGQSSSGALVSTIQQVDTATHRAVVVGSMGVALAASVAGRLDGTVYLAGGLVGTPKGAVATRAVFELVPGEPLRQVATLPVPVANAGGAVIGKKLYVVGGEGTAGEPLAYVQVVRVSLRSAHRAQHA
jgi:hypothetical protein